MTILDGRDGFVDVGANIDTYWVGEIGNLEVFTTIFELRRVKRFKTCCDRPFRHLVPPRAAKRK